MKGNKLNTRLTAVLLIAMFVVGMIPFATFTVSATTSNVPLFDNDFETNPLEHGWSAVDMDGDGNNWYYHSGDASGAHSGYGVMRSDSWKSGSGALTPRNRLWTPFFSVPTIGTVTLSYWAKGFSDYCEEVLDVCYAFKDGDGVPVIINHITTTNQWTQYTVDLTPFAGRELRICFIHEDCTDQYYISLDDVAVNTAVDFSTYSDLADAVNNTGKSLTFATGNEYPWYVKYDAISGKPYAVSGNTGCKSTSSYLQTRINLTANTKISFDYKAMGETGTNGKVWDACVFTVDEQHKFRLGAEGSGWHTYSVTLPAGLHSLTWAYVKNADSDPEGDFFAVKNLMAGTYTYSLKIGGTSVTNLNASDVLGDGVFCYDATSNILYVNGSYTATSGPVIESRMNNLVIIPTRYSTLTSNTEATSATVMLHNSAVIAGDGTGISVYNNGNGPAISLESMNGNLTVYQTHLYVKGGHGIFSAASGNGLHISNSTVSAHAEGGFGIMGFGSGIFLLDCEYENESWGCSEDGTVVDSLGSPLRDVHIVRDDVHLFGYVNYADDASLRGEVVRFEDLDPYDTYVCNNLDLDKTLAMDYCDGYLCGYDVDGSYFRSAMTRNPNQSEDSHYVNAIFGNDQCPIDCSYDPYTEWLYVLVYDSHDDCQYIYATTDIETGEVVKLCQPEVWLEAIAFDDDGNMCVIYNEEGEYYFSAMDYDNGEITGSAWEHELAKYSSSYFSELLYSTEYYLRLTFDWASGRFYLGVADEEYGTRLFGLDYDGYFEHDFTIVGAGLGETFPVYSAIFTIPDFTPSPYAFGRFSFESGDPYEDYDEYCWTPSEGNTFYVDYDDSLAFDGDCYMTHKYYETPEDVAFAVTPVIRLPETPSEFVIRVSSEDADSLQKFSVAIKRVVSNELDNAEDARVSNEPVYLIKEETAGFGYHTYKFDLSAYAGDNVIIAVVHNYTDTSGWLSFDDVEFRFGESHEDERRGDVDGNGVIEAKDYLMAKRAVLNSFQLDEGQKYRADIDGNDAVEASDYLKIKRHVLGTYTIPGWEK